VLLGVVLTFALTGYLLPWDQKGYWATQVATSIIGTLPLVGGPLQTLVQGGPTYGNLTLTRFYALHVFVMPALVFTFTAIHVYMFRRHGVTPPPGMLPAEALEKQERFFPRQLLLDAVFSLAVILGVVVFAIAEKGAPLAAPADPSSPYLARPEWYFLPLFQLLKYFGGSLEWIGTLVIPGLAVGFMVALPFLYAYLRKRGRRPRRLLATVFTLGLAVVAGMGLLAVVEDATNVEFGRMEKDAQLKAAEARRLAQVGVPVKGPLFLYENDPVVYGLHVFRAQCATCHQSCEKSPYKGDPCLAAYASRDWLTRLIREPRHPHFFGNTAIDEMDAFTGPEQTLDSIVEFLYAQAERKDVNAALAKKGEAAFEAEGCGTCHGLDGVGTGLAPDLKGYASVQWLSAFIRKPDAPRFYGEKNQMDAFGWDKLSQAEAAAVVSYLHALGEQTLEYP
jgi:ubiquinol-cytochrome c reductase cytochrome b subunit